jgi:Flp pilus assembly protein TadG
MSRPRLPSFNAHRRIAGVVTIEYALLLMLGMFPLLMLTFTGVMVFSAQQSLSLAAAEGARASLRYGDDASRRAAACNAASEAMGWLLTFSKQSSACSNPTAPPVQVTGPFVCSGSSDRQCMRVTVSYDYNTHPLLPGTGTLFGWTLGSPLQSAATAQLDLGN